MPDEAVQLELLPHDDSPPVPVREQIGGGRRFVIRSSGILWRSWQDVNTSDYAFWDKARRGKARGLEISGLLIKPLGSKIASWVFNSLPFWQTDRKAISSPLNHWWREQMSSIVRAYEEALMLGDAYIVFNGDSSLTVVSADMVEPIVDDTDTRNWIGWRVIVTVPLPAMTATADNYGATSGGSMTYEDSYYADRRVSRVLVDGMPKGATVIYPNPTGKVPVIHLANKFGSDERFGRPEAEALLAAMYRYGDIADAAFNGNIRQGRPTPVIYKAGSAANILEIWERYGSTETITNADGTVETVNVIHFDPDQLLTLGGDAQFKYEAPGSFSVDTQNLLGLLFYLILQHCEVPEFIWGAGINASKASTDSQLEPFIKFIEKKRLMAMEWMTKLAEMFLAWTAAFNQRARNLKPTAFWKPMSAVDARLTLDSVIWMFAKKIIDPELATWLVPLNIADPSVVKDRAEAYWGVDEYATTSADTLTPASGGGNQDVSSKQENPVQPTERAMTAEDKRRAVEQFVAHLDLLYPTPDEPELALNGNGNGAAHVLAS